MSESAFSVSQGNWFFGASRLRFTPAAPGGYRFISHVDGHAEKGMTGTLVVLP